MENQLKINKPCPKCKAKNSVIIDQHKIECTQEGCSFSKEYQCPLCDASIQSSCFSEDDKQFTCVDCQSIISVEKIKYLIENGLKVSQEETCSYCGAATILRPQVNIKPRCFFHPSCSGQTSLFGTKKESYVFLDFETTGLEAGKDSVIEFGAIKVDQDGTEHTFQRFVKPLEPVTPYISSLTGITNDMLEGSFTLKEALSDFVSFLGDSILIAHNADFDVPWLTVSCKRHQIPLTNLQIVCTLEWAKVKKESSASLKALTKKYAIGHANAHRALADAVATKELFFIYESDNASTRPVKKLTSYQALTKTIVERYPNLIQP